MDIRRLKYFIAVVEEGSITRAAERLHISQPPLTRYIQNLEEELGVPLFARTSRGVELNQAGTALLNHAYSIEAQIERVTKQIRSLAFGHSGRLDIGVYGSALLNIIPRILTDFVERYPNVNIVLHSARKELQIEALHKGHILIAFDRYFQEFADLRSELVTREPIWVAINQRHTLADKSSISLDDLRNEPLIGEMDQSISIAVNGLFRNRKFEPLFVQRASDMISAVTMVAGGVGSALVPESVLTLKLPEVAYRPLIAEDECLIDLHCVYRKDEDSPLLFELLDFVHAYRFQPEIG